MPLVAYSAVAGTAITSPNAPFPIVHVEDAESLALDYGAPIKSINNGNPSGAFHFRGLICVKSETQRARANANNTPDTGMILFPLSRYCGGPSCPRTKKKRKVQPTAAAAVKANFLFCCSNLPLLDTAIDHRIAVPPVLSAALPRLHSIFQITALLSYPWKT